MSLTSMKNRKRKINMKEKHREEEKKVKFPEFGLNMKTRKLFPNQLSYD